MNKGFVSEATIAADVYDGMVHTRSLMVALAQRGCEDINHYPELLRFAPMAREVEVQRIVDALAYAFDRVLDNGRDSSAAVSINGDRVGSSILIRIKMERDIPTHDIRIGMDGRVSDSRELKVRLG